MILGFNPNSYKKHHHKVLLAGLIGYEEPKDADTLPTNLEPTKALSIRMDLY